MIKVVITRHAERRARQCGVPPALIDTVLHYADIELPMVARHVALRLSAASIHQLRDEHGPALADRAATVVLILGDGVVLTVLRAAGQPSRRYLRRRR
jgi:hypothetical protein